MAQLTAAAGVTLHDPTVFVEGDSRTPGWSGGLVYSRSVVGRVSQPVRSGAKPDLGPGKEALYDSGSIHHSLKFTVTADSSSSTQGWAMMQVRTDAAFAVGYRYQKADTSGGLTSDYLTKQSPAQSVYTSHAYTGPGAYEVRIVGGTLTVLKNGAAIFTQAVADAALDVNTRCGIVTGRCTVTQISVTALDAAGTPLTDPIPAFDYRTVTGARIVNPGLSFSRDTAGITVAGSDYHQALAAVRTAADLVTGQRTTAGVTLRDPLNPQPVTTPPVLKDAAAPAPRIQRQQRFGAQGIFFFDLGSPARRTAGGRFGAAGVLDGNRTGVDVRAAGSGASLFAQQLAAGAATDVRTGAGGVTSFRSLDQGMAGARAAAGAAAFDFLSTTDVAGYAGRNGITRDQALLISFFDTYEEFWRSAAAYPWPGGVLPPPAAVAPDLAVEWGYFIVPTGSIPPGQSYPGGTTKTWVYRGFNNGVDSSGGYYQSSSTLFVPAGDLYVYSYGPHYNQTDPEPQLPPPPAGVAYASNLSASPPGSAGALTGTPPANDSLYTATPIDGLSGSVVFSDAVATLDVGEPDLGIGDQQFRGTVWFTWAPGYTGDITLESPGVALEVYRGDSDDYLALLPLGAGAGSVTTSVLNGYVLYIRAYPLTAENTAATLTWTTHPPTLEVFIPVADIPTAPATINATIANATPGATVTFTFDAGTDAVATAVADADGFVSVPIPIPDGFSPGTHLLQASEAGRVGNMAFTVGAGDFTIPVDDPTPPPVVVVPPTTVPRWTFQDPTNSTTWQFILNPTTADSPVLPRNLTSQHSTAVNGQPIVFEGGRRARRWTLNGHVFSLAELDALKAWRKPYRVYLTDDLGRTYVVKVLGVTATVKRDPARPEHMQYVMSCLLYGRIT